MALNTLTQPDEADHPDVVIGVDTHKGVHLAVALAPNGGRLGECSIPVNRQGYSDLQAWALKHGSKPVFAIEGTGSYGAGLCRDPMASGFPVREINRPDRSSRRRVGKDDAIDAEPAARAFIAGTATIAPKGGHYLVEMIRLRKGNKDSGTSGRTRAINQVKAILKTAPAALREQLETLIHADLMTTCAAFHVAVVDCPVAAAKKALRFLARRVLRLEQEIAELLEDLDQLTIQVCPGLRLTYGIGVASCHAAGGRG